MQEAVVLSKEYSKEKETSIYPYEHVIKTGDIVKLKIKGTGENREYLIVNAIIPNNETRLSLVDLNTGLVDQEYFMCYYKSFSDLINALHKAGTYKLYSGEDTLFQPGKEREQE